MCRTEWYGKSWKVVEFYLNYYSNLVSRHCCFKTNVCKGMIRNLYFNNIRTMCTNQQILIILEQCVQIWCYVNYLWRSVASCDILHLNGWKTAMYLSIFTIWRVLCYFIFRFLQIYVILFLSVPTVLEFHTNFSFTCLECFAFV